MLLIVICTRVNESYASFSWVTHTHSSAFKDHSIVPNSWKCHDTRTVLQFITSLNTFSVARVYRLNGTGFFTKP